MTENDHKEPELASEAEPFDSYRDGLEEEALRDDLEQELGNLEGDDIGEQNKSKPEEKIENSKEPELASEAEQLTATAMA